MTLVLLFLLQMASIPEGRSAGTLIPGQEILPRDSVLQAVHEAYGTGRFWRGTRLLRGNFDSEAFQDPALRVLLAEGEAGWGNWGAVRELLEEALGTGSVSGARPWILLGLSLESMEAWEGAAEAYGKGLRVLEDTPGAAPPFLSEPGAIRARQVRALARLERFQEARPALSRIRSHDPLLGDWLGLEVAELSADEGEPEATRVYLSSVETDHVRQEGWDLPARSLLAAGDSAGAEAAFWSALPGLDSWARRAEAWTQVARLRAARGDSAGARGAYHQVLGEGAGGEMGLEAATSLLTLGLDSVRAARRSAELLAGAGRLDASLAAWERYLELSKEDPSPQVRLSLARLHLRRGDPARTLERVEPLLEDPSEGVGGPALVLQSQALRDLGRTAEGRRVQDTLMARFPNRPESVEILFLRADARQDRGDLAGALEGFQATVQLAPAQNLAGQARMRMGQIHISQGRLEAAARVYQGYLDAFPDGRRWDEAAFWAARSLQELGETDAAHELLGRLQARFPLSYYTVQAGVLLNQDYAPSLSPPSDSLPLDEDLAEGVALVERLLQGGLEAAAQKEVDRLVDRVRDEDIPGASELTGEEGRRVRMLGLARVLSHMGFTREGINLGWSVVRMGGKWDGDLLAAVYPFPYRTLVMETARELGLDPFLMAGLMRQESAFWARAVSRADARGLMQVLPATGAELARARGPNPFHADEHLFRPEVNVHLGMAFFSDMRRRFGEDLSIILSAYNAGPTRARRWREFPEAGDLPRFVERIPFTETRGYVKNVLRNREIYTWLYGRGEAGAGSREAEWRTP